MASPEAPLGEPRWPPITALVVLIVLNIGLRLWLRHEPLVGFPWLVPVLEIALLGILLLADQSLHPRPISISVFVGDEPARRQRWATSTRDIADTPRFAVLLDSTIGAMSSNRSRFTGQSTRSRLAELLKL